MPNPWDIPPIEESGNDTYDEIWRSVGEALTRWEEVEGAMADIYSAIVFPTNVWSPLVPPAVRGYGSIVGFRGRLEMIRAAASEFFHQRVDSQVARDPALPADIKRLLDKTSEFSNRRNDIAHGVVMPYIHPDGGHGGHYLFPGLYASKKWKKAGFIGGDAAYALTAAQIAAFAQHFDDLQTEITTFPHRFVWMQEP